MPCAFSIPGGPATSPSSRLKQRVAIVTGTARGIGLACAQRFAAEDALLVLADLDEATRTDAVASAPGAVFARTDITPKAQVDGLVPRALALHGRVDVLVNNAGITHSCDFLELAEDDFDRVLAVNLNSMFVCEQAVARAMVMQGSAGRSPTCRRPTQSSRSPNHAYNRARGPVSILALRVHAEF